MAACPRVASAGGWVIRGLRGGFARSTLIPCSASATEKAYISRTQPSFFLDSGSASIWAVNRSQSGVTCNAPNNVQTLCCAVLCCAVLCCAVLCCAAATPDAICLPLVSVESAASCSQPVMRVMPLLPPPPPKPYMPPTSLPNLCPLAPIALLAT